MINPFILNVSKFFLKLSMLLASPTAKKSLIFAYLVGIIVQNLI